MTKKFDAKNGRFILVTRKTRLEELVERFNTWPQAKFYLEHNNTNPADYVAEHDQYKAEVLKVQTVLQKQGRFQLLERSYLPSYQFGDNDLVVVIGQDGLVANTLKYLQGQPVVGINPDPARWDGPLLRFEAAQIADVIKNVTNNTADSQQITFAQAQTNDGQTLQAVNDLFIGPQSHTSARYTLVHGTQREEQSSSGIIVSTGFGSTGWLQSILAGARGVYPDSETHVLSNGFDWNAEQLQFAVREPFPSLTTGTQLVFGTVQKNDQLTIESRMPERGVIFSDGMEQDFLTFNAGTVATISVSPIKGRLVI